MHADNLQHKQVQLLLKRAKRLEEIITEQKANDFFGAASATEFERCGFELLCLMNTLNAHYVDNEQLPLYDITGKAHIAGHCFQRAAYINVRHTWCYMGEEPRRPRKPKRVQSARLQAELLV